MFHKGGDTNSNPKAESDCYIHFSGLSEAGAVRLGIKRSDPNDPTSSFIWVNDGGNLDSQLNRFQHLDRQCGVYNVGPGALWHSGCGHGGIPTALCEL